MWTPSWFVLARPPSFVTFFPFLPALARKRESENRAQKKSAPGRSPERWYAFSLSYRDRGIENTKKGNMGKKTRKVLSWEDGRMRSPVEREEWVRQEEGREAGDPMSDVALGFLCLDHFLSHLADTPPALTLALT